MSVNRQVILKSRPAGIPQEEHFEIVPGITVRFEPVVEGGHALGRLAVDRILLGQRRARVVDQEGEGALQDEECLVFVALDVRRRSRTRPDLPLPAPVRPRGSGRSQRAASKR